VDFVVVGSGSAGGVIARELSQAGLTVLVFEQGPRLSPADFEHDELKYWFLSGITSGPASSPQTFRKDPADAAKLPRGPNPLVHARLVGGSSNHYNDVRAITSASSQNAMKFETPCNGRRATGGV
jgi:choline dehydrogenase-like flavoprotein